MTVNNFYNRETSILIIIIICFPRSVSNTFIYKLFFSFRLQDAMAKTTTTVFLCLHEANQIVYSIIFSLCNWYTVNTPSMDAIRISATQAIIVEEAATREDKEVSNLKDITLTKRTLESSHLRPSL